MKLKHKDLDEELQNINEIIINLLELEHEKKKRQVDLLKNEIVKLPLEYVDSRGLAMINSIITTTFADVCKDGK
jgi:hypothetical protein